MTVDTRKAPRRELNFKCLRCLAKDLDALDAAHARGTLRTTGNWTAGEILDHCAILFECGLDGPKVVAPWFARVFGRLMRRSVLKPRTMPAGYQLPDEARALFPRPGVPYEEGMARLRAALARIERGERMTHPSGFLGPMTHDEWVRLNLNHTQLHLGFMSIGGFQS
jgi:hypothetical protein